MHIVLAGLFLAVAYAPLAAQAPGKWPPDSLVNVKVFPRSTPVMQVRSEEHTSELQSPI